MPLLHRLFIVALFAVPTVFAQQDAADGERPEPVTAKTSSPPQDTQAGEETQGSSPPLRDEFEPQERISKDKAESFPPDI
ncbi:MAG: hypothetical protein ACPG1A_02215 [Halioglobus sp.]